MPELDLDTLVDFLWKSAAALVAVLAVLILYRLAVRGLVTYQNRGRLSEPIVRNLRRILRIVATALIAVAVLQSFGVLQSAWATVSGLLALVAIGFVAVWSVLSNAMCAVMLLVTRPFEVGDTVELVPEGLKGEVVNFTFVFTTLRDADGSQIRVPNNLFFQRVIRCTKGSRKVKLDEQLLREKDAA